jgi:hypothetical protein
MPTENQIERLAAMANAIRPEWPIRSLLTILTRDHATRPYRDLAVALAWIATDAKTKTPARLAEAGPWWTATSMTEGAGPGQSRMQCADHERWHAGHCPDCIAQAVPRPDNLVIPRPTRSRDWTPKPVHADLTAARDSIDAKGVTA